MNRKRVNKLISLGEFPAHLYEQSFCEMDQLVSIGHFLVV